MIEEVSSVTNNLCAQNLHHGNLLHQYLEEQTKTLNSIRTMTEPRQHTREELVEFRAVSLRTSAVCDNGCTCNCHTTQIYESSPFLEKVLGKLFIAYAGSPVGFTSRCDLASCHSTIGCRAHVSYAFPSWFCAKAITSLFFASPLGDPSMALVVRRVVPQNAELFQLANIDDDEGIRRLLSARMASPMDIQFETGRTALHVSLLNNPAVIDLELFSLTSRTGLLRRHSIVLCLQVMGVSF